MSKFSIDDSENVELFYNEESTDNSSIAPTNPTKTTNGSTKTVEFAAAEYGISNNDIADDGDAVTTGVEQFDVEEASGYTGILGGWLKSYSQWFDVGVSDVVRRIGRVVMPWKGELILGGKGVVVVGENEEGQGGEEGVEEKVDLYGPFWLTTTLVLCIAMGANVYELLKGVAMKREVGGIGSGLGKYAAVDFKNLVEAALVFYGYVGGASVVVWGGKRYLKLGGGLVYALCVYGYSMAPLIPAVLVCAVAHEIVSWVVLILAFGLSAMFVLRNIWIEPLSDDALNPGGAGIIGAVSGQPRSSAWYFRFASTFVHCLLGAVVKFRFF
eukprot:Plantae.Rhodophyta-Hildenbrandia_rubra.ctg25289.p1 GENE.Plantae.Rhodophyta-Hildenbrandia_rubra.ctg25289~~Plantae.Rhodophyta-Hildenbrandia_rubra.ctg25289.p1  ORF type:complete len:327 (+),score=69.35 Plantae.Rhodophyta-Hildenbrandia_rubra.ctg25289:266-1246(+)